MNREEANALRSFYIGHYRLNINRRHLLRDLPESLLFQLLRCSDEAARRLILGVSEKYTEGDVREEMKIKIRIESGEESKICWSVSPPSDELELLGESLKRRDLQLSHALRELAAVKKKEA